MRVPVDLIGRKNIPLIEEFLGEKVRRTGIGKIEKLVFRKDQWKKFLETVESQEETLNPSPMSEASGVVLRAYSMLLKNYAAAKTTPVGRISIIAAVMSIYAADPGVGSRLQFALNL